MDYPVDSAAQKRLLDALVRQKRLSRDQYENALALQSRDGSRIEDVLIERGMIEETALLKFIAGIYKTRSASTEKLSKADIDRSTLELIPRQMAEDMMVFPVQFKAKDKSLAFVLADPHEPSVSEQVQTAAGVSGVKAYVARPAAIRAAIHKHYGGDIHAFAKLDTAGYDQFKEMLDTYERNLLTEDDMTGGMAAINTFEGSSYGSQSFEVDTGLTPGLGASGISAPEPPQQVAAMASGIELANVLVTLLENQREELRGHSSQVARLLQSVGEHMGLSPGDVYGLRLAGLLHDVGKVSSYHLTALNVSEYEGHRTHAQKCFQSPGRLFEAADLPQITMDALNGMYERCDGGGFPDRKAAKDIPLAARLLAIAETYADLTSNARNPFRKTLTPKAAMEVLGRYKDTIFDANLVDLFRVAALGEDMQQKLLNDRPKVVLVDADAEETTILELRLVEQGCEVVLCRTAKQAVEHFNEGGVDAVITEVDLKPHDGFQLVTHLRKLKNGQDLPVLFLTRRSDRQAVDQGFQLGAVDYIIKPAAPDVVVAKARNALQKAVRLRGGIAGSLSEMSLPDVLQVISRTRKSGLLKIASGGYVGEIHLGEGEIYNAMFMHLRGEEAVYTMVTLNDGEFSLDPSFTPADRVINHATENLLLEGMRRMDERNNNQDFGSTQVDER